MRRRKKWRKYEEEHFIVIQHKKKLNYLIDVNDEKMVEIAIKKENKETFSVRLE